MSATPKPNTGLTELVLYLSVNFKYLHTTGKKYPWPRPERCPRCGGVRLWGHGYVDRYFDGEPDALSIKRWRCTDCGAVHTMRPSTHWRGFWAPWHVIFRSLLEKAAGKKWPEAVSRQKQQYWWRGYRIQSRISGEPVGLWKLLFSGRIVATHSLTHREIRSVYDSTYRIFAVTGPSRGP